MSPPLAYARQDDSLVLLPAGVLDALAEADRVLRTSTTFADYVAGRDAASPAARRYLWWWDDEGIELEDLGVTLAAPFDPELLPGGGDGLFPVDPRTVMLDALDEDVAELLEPWIRIDDHLGGVPRMVIPWSARDEVVMALRSASCSVIECLDHLGAS